MYETLACSHTPHTHMHIHTQYNHTVWCNTLALEQPCQTGSQLTAWMGTTACSAASPSLHRPLFKCSTNYVVCSTYLHKQCRTLTTRGNAFGKLSLPQCINCMPRWHIHCYVAYTLFYLCRKHLPTCLQPQVARGTPSLSLPACLPACMRCS